MRLLASLFALLLASPALFAAGVSTASPPRVAISPLIPPGPDEGLELGKTFADLLGAQLSSWIRWELVERSQLPDLEQEWLVKGSGLAYRSASLRLGALARADLVLECRVSPAGEENPTCTVAVIETARAETLAQIGANPWDNHTTPGTPPRQACLVDYAQRLRAAGAKVTWEEFPAISSAPTATMQNAARAFLAQQLSP